jgi:hypothetical protein
MTKGERISSLVFTREEIEAAIQRAKPRAFDEAAETKPDRSPGKPALKPVASGDGK